MHGAACETSSLRGAHCSLRLYCRDLNGLGLTGQLPTAWSTLAQLEDMCVAGAGLLRVLQRLAY